ncbi:uncharacterized protein PHALS_13039 [Plasmopara halstedii]|uniref:Uncharacterized protein n=1 Tax=Plasmopara halstedii TaxID=4781 RepID=A0A0P1AP04_PLAHL|nr:uncharacterized protein PHALS_13039 [Plasmopara halstedii]CEG42792.1 hypothetical protein PHALS_13039 [Plasmopara halstedii]|eukprot:XP_024579161.1 hypothetical protein PHALS_13039 [Plasmopara halstedii]
MSHDAAGGSVTRDIRDAGLILLERHNILSHSRIVVWLQNTHAEPIRVRIRFEISKLQLNTFHVTNMSGTM